MRLYTFYVTLADSGLPYPDYASALKDADEWACGLADTENCMVAAVKVIEEEVQDSYNS